MGPTPTSTNNPHKNCLEVISSNCVFWDYDDVPCLGICRGMKMTDVMYKEAVMTCQLLAQITGDIAIINSIPAPVPPIDFSVLKLGCASNPANPTPTTLIQVLQLIIDSLPCCDPC